MTFIVWGYTNGGYLYMLKDSEISLKYVLEARIEGRM